MKDNPFKKAIASHKQSSESVTEEIAPTDEKAEAMQEIPVAAQLASESTPTTSPKKRGRPATGKRSDDSWIGRTYYVKRSTDLDVEEELLKLKRRGVEIDKSELVDFIMAVWVKWQQGENIDLLLDEFTPRRNSKLE